MTPSARRQVVEALMEQRLSVQRACRVVRLSRTAFYQPPLPASRRDAVVIAALTDAVARYPRWGGRAVTPESTRRTGAQRPRRRAWPAHRGPDRQRPEFTAQPFADWCTEHGIACHYIQPGKPDQNAYIERFNRTYRTEVLNAHLFESIAELQALTRQWLRVYNQERPHDSLGRVPPLTFLPRPTTVGQSPWELSA